MPPSQNHLEEFSDGSSWHVSTGLSYLAFEGGTWILENDGDYHKLSQVMASVATAVPDALSYHVNKPIWCSPYSAFNIASVLFFLHTSPQGLPEAVSFSYTFYDSTSGVIDYIPLCPNFIFRDLDCLSLLQDIHYTDDLTVNGPTE